MNLWDENSSDLSAPPQKSLKRPGSPNGSHGVALTQSSVKKQRSERVTIRTTEVHLTVRIANKSLTRRHFRLILDVLLYEIVTEGITLERYLLLVHMYQTLLGQKLDALDLNNEHERRLILLSEVIMKSLADKEFEIWLPKQVIPEDLAKEIIDSNLIMTKRTYNSRKGHWNPELWMTVRPVGIDSIIERSGNSERYSAYCKGYGESHPSAHYKKTRPSAELDGEESKQPEDISLLELRQLLILTKLNLKPKASRVKS